MGEIGTETKELMRLVLSHYAQCGVIGTACDKAGVRRKTHYDWYEKHERYKELFDELRERFVDGLEEVAIERAKTKSDSLLMFLLKAERREKFGDKADIELSGRKQGAPIQLVFAEGMLNDDEKAMLSGEKKEGEE
jgi:hypothetical protein